MSQQKKCGMCQSLKEHPEFGVNRAKKDGLKTQCRECKREMQSRWYARNKGPHTIKVNLRRKERALATRKLIYAYLLEHPCVDCGDPDPLMLEFDHVRGEKQNEISQMVSDGLAWQRILSEIAKCEVRCVRCHRRRTTRQFNFSKLVFPQFIETRSSSNG